MKNEKKVDKQCKFRAKNIYLIDGTTITMPDTVANQNKYSHPKTQKEGLGFPICCIVAIISLTRRIEPRLIKKWCNAYQLLMKSRILEREDVIKNRHPKM